MVRINSLRWRRAVRGFTFVEVLVVVAIVAVLAAVLFPVFASAQSGAHGYQDLDHLAQLTKAEAIYAHDADDRFLAVGSPAVNYAWTPARNPNVDAAGNPWMGWGLRLAPYCLNYEIFKSPSKPAGFQFSGPCAGSAGMPISNGYLLNWMLGGDGTYGNPANLNDSYAWSPDSTWPFDQPVAVSAIQSPSNTIAFTLAHSLFASNWGCLYVTVQASDYSNQIQPEAFQSEGANIAFADGSARLIKYDQMSPSEQGPHPWTVYHLISQKVWMEPTMPASNLGFVNLDDQGRPLGGL